MTDEQFRDILRKFMEKRDFNKSDLARYLGLKHYDIHRMLNKNQSPRGTLMFDVLSTLGWDFSRAKPGYDPAKEVALAMEEDAATYQSKRKKRKVVVGQQPTLTLDGFIEGGSGKVFWKSGMLSDLPFDLVRKDEGTFCLRVQGDGMKDFPDGSLIVTKQVKKREFPDGKTVILKNNLLRKIKKISGAGSRFLCVRPTEVSENDEFELSAAGMHSVVINSIRLE